ncbi:MAG TPA: hypothetical protein VGH59_14695 [Casimicrobiaceae bacterium]|jgi:hypothetical protein
MRRHTYITVKTEQDIEAACKRMDDREREMLEEFGDDVADGEYEQRARWAQKCLGSFDDAW